MEKLQVSDVTFFIFTESDHLRNQQTFNTANTYRIYFSIPDQWNNLNWCFLLHYTSNSHLYQNGGKKGYIKQTAAEDAPENSKETSHSAHANGMNEWMNELLTVFSLSVLEYLRRVSRPRICESTVFSSDSLRDLFIESRSSSVSFSFKSLKWIATIMTVGNNVMQWHICGTKHAW